MSNNSMPRTEGEWRRSAEENKVSKQSLRMNVELHSASKVTYKQFLLFRTILPPIVCAKRLNTNALGIANLMAEANQILSDTAFRDYISAVTTRRTRLSWNPPWEGSDRLFRVPAIQQQQVIRGEVEQSSRQPSEASVNTSIVSFLQALADLVPRSGRQWTADRKELKADFSTARRERNFIAITDGQLEDTSSHKMVALIECKRSRRARHTPGVDKQEVAQMVAWVKNSPGAPGDNRRVLVSQDGTQVFISVFQYDQGWLRYLNSGPGSIKHAGFAYMQRYGPWNIQVAPQMEHFARIIIALTLL